MIADLAVWYDFCQVHNRIKVLNYANILWRKTLIVLWVCCHMFLGSLSYYLSSDKHLSCKGFHSAWCFPRKWSISLQYLVWNSGNTWGVIGLIISSGHSLHRKCWHLNNIWNYNCSIKYSPLISCSVAYLAPPWPNW